MAAAPNLWAKESPAVPPNTSSPSPRDVLAEAPGTRVELLGEPVRVALTVPPVSRTALSALFATARPTRRLVLTVEGIDFDKPPGFYWELYLNLPEGVTRADMKSGHYIGNLALFGHARQGEEGGATASEVFDVTPFVAKLKRLGRFREDRLTVTFTPQFSGDRSGRRSSPPNPAASFRRLILTVE